MPKLTPHPWAHGARFYHIYPLGCCGALHSNTPGNRLERLHDWIDHLAYLGVNALYLGPVFASASHGYDVLDYYHVDPRLGESHALRNLVQEMHARRIRVVLDGVFNHVGRDFWAFRDLRHHLQDSAYKEWFQRLSFQMRGRSGDPFCYQGWRRGHHEMVKLNLNTPAVKAHLFGALEYWVRAFDIDGLRLDAAHCMNQKFLAQLANRGRALKRDFWMMGEVIDGDYRKWLDKGKLDAVTNYSLCESLRRAHWANDYHILAGTLDYQFGTGGACTGMHLYNFVDNHDMTRAASYLKKTAHLYPLHILLFTLPGIPAIYYASEWGQQGEKGRRSDDALRPSIPHPYHWQPKDHQDLISLIHELSGLHDKSSALQYGELQLLYVKPHTMAYLRRSRDELIVVVVHSGCNASERTLHLPWGHGQMVDLLNPGECFTITQNAIRLKLYPCWGRILQWQAT